MRYTAALLDEIRNRLPLSQVVGRRVTWDKRKSQPAKGDYWACCPFHGEKSPSFHADDRRGRYHCFGCGADGDAFTFLTETEGLSFPEAVERLAGEAGVTLPAPDARAEAEERRRHTLHDVLAAAADFFVAALRGRQGGAARRYLEGRRIGPNLQGEFGLGYAPDSRSALKTHLADMGIAQELMVEAGLLVTGEDVPVSFDRFRDRVMFPIHDLRGRIVGFGGRSLSAEVQPKYLNSPETPVFHKGTLLYRGHVARAAAHSAGSVIVVEGYADVIAMAAAGFTHTVAPLGTAMTEDQLRLLWRMAPEPILCFDGDEAGRKAAFRAIDLALPHLKPGQSLRFALLPDGVDPDDLIGQGGAPAMAEVLQGALPLVEMLWRQQTEGVELDTPERRAALDQRLRQAAESIGDSEVKRHYRQALSERAAAFFAPPARDREAIAGPRRGGGFRGRNLDWRGAQASGPTARRHQPPPPIAASSRLQRAAAARSSGLPPLAEAMIVAPVLRHPGLLSHNVDAFAHAELGHRPLASLRDTVLDIVGHDPDIGAAALQEALQGRGGAAALAARIDHQVREAGAWPKRLDEDPVAAEASWLQAMTLHRRARALHKELRQAEAALAREGTAESLQRLVDIQREMSTIEGIETEPDGLGRSFGRAPPGL